MSIGGILEARVQLIACPNQENTYNSRVRRHVRVRYMQRVDVFLWLWLSWWVEIGWEPAVC